MSGLGIGTVLAVRAVHGSAEIPRGHMVVACSKPNHLTNQDLDKAKLTGFLLEKTARRLKQYFQQMLSKRGYKITVDQWVILQALYEKQEQSQLELAQATYKDAPTVTRIIDLLQKQDLVNRRADPEDRRRFKVELTAEGHQLIEELAPVLTEFRQTAWRDITVDQMNMLEQILNTVFTNLIAE